MHKAQELLNNCTSMMRLLVKLLIIIIITIIIKIIKIIKIIIIIYHTIYNNTDKYIYIYIHI